MKKVLITLLALFLLVTVSCATKNETVEITEEMASYSMQLAVNTAIQKANKAMFNAMKNGSEYIPEAYSVLKATQQEVPGLTTLLGRWYDDFSSFMTDTLDSFFSYVQLLSDSLVFENAISFVDASPTSGTEFFASLYKQEITALLQGRLEGFDTSALKHCLVQYENKAVMYPDFNLSYTGVDTANIEKVIAQDMADMYFSYIAEYEELFRTTPDPYGDNTASLVFGAT